MSEIKSKVYEELWFIAQDVRLGNLSEQEATDKILSIDSLAVVDREAKVPQREKLADTDLLLRAQDKNDIYLNGQIIAQGKMLKANWVREDKDEPTR